MRNPSFFLFNAETDRSSMPLGNGEVGISAWVEEDGDLQFYIARTDALTELDRNVKLGKVRIRLSPNPIGRGKTFRQELRLCDGILEVRAGDGKEEVLLKVFVDAESPTVYVTGESDTPFKAKATYVTWRTNFRPSGKDSPLSDKSHFGIVETPDVVTALKGDIFFLSPQRGNVYPRARGSQDGA